MTRQEAIKELWLLSEFDAHYDDITSNEDMESIMSDQITDLEHELIIIQGNY